MKMNEQRPRRIIVPLQKSGDGVVRVDRVNSVSGMLDRALGIIDEQLIKIGLKSRTATLDEKEARVLQGYVKSLVELSKEEREREKADKTPDELKEMSDAELLELANSKLAAIKEPNKPS
jgi:hypothetical protein